MWVPVLVTVIVQVMVSPASITPSPSRSCPVPAFTTRSEPFSGGPLVVNTAVARLEVMTLSSVAVPTAVAWLVTEPAVMSASVAA